MYGRCLAAGRSGGLCWSYTMFGVGSFLVLVLHLPSPLLIYVDRTWMVGGSVFYTIHADW